MNFEIEQKLKELWHASQEQNALAVHVVTHLLLANLQNGTVGDFAKWCCRYSTGFSMETTTDDNLPGLPSEFTTDIGTKEWIC